MTMTRNELAIRDVQEFVAAMRESGECRTITTRYTDKGMIVTITLTEEGTMPESYMFEWEDE